MEPDQNGGMTPEVEEFFATGDASVLQAGLGQDDTPPEPAQHTGAPTPAAKVEDNAPNPMEIALENERQRRADLERKLAELEAKQKAAPVEDQMPDEATDPIGYINAMLRKTAAAQAALEQRLAEQRQQEELRKQYDEFAANVRAIKEEFAKGHPDFDAAYKHLRDIKLADLTDGGMSRQEAMRRINQEELQLAANALERGKNPAEVVYNMAARYGYKATAQQQQAADQKSQQQAEQKVDRLKNGQFASRAPQRSAPPSKGDITVEGLKDASDKDLNNIVTNDDMWAQVVGGKAGIDIFHH